jgi:uncharacterized protein YcnI
VATVKRPSTHEGDVAVKLSTSLKLGAAAGGLLAIVAVGSASAHITIEETEVAAGSSAILTVSVPHGCEASPTIGVRIQMPESIPSVTPTRNANWDVDKVMETLETPVEGPFGEQLTERVSEVVYTARTPLPDGYRDAFELSLRIPDDAAGQPLYFPTIQVCEVGESAWIEIPEPGQDPEQLDLPAPFVLVVETASDTEAAATADTVAEATVPVAPETTG